MLKWYRRHLSKGLTAAAIVLAVIPCVALMSPQETRADMTPPASAAALAAASTPSPTSAPAVAASCTPDENHASIRLAVDQPASGGQASVDEQGNITVSGIVHKHATMDSVTDEAVTTSDFTLGPPPDGVAAWAASWSTALRPPHLGSNQVCVRAERDPKRIAQILQSFTVVDNIPPSNVTGLAVNDITSTGAVVSWDAATDNYGLAGYDVSVDGGSPHRTTVGTRNFTVSGLAPSTSHTVSVVAVDLAGNTSTTPATASFDTTAPPPPPNGNLTITPEEGSAVATWQPDPGTDSSYQVLLNGQPIDDFSLGQYCQDASGNPASPCTAQDTISYSIDPLDEGTSYDFEVEALAADGTQSRTISGSFTTTTTSLLVSDDTRQMDASQTSSCAAMGGDFYVAPSARASVTIPDGATQIFAGCYKAANDSCIRGFLPPSGNQVISCSDDVTTLLNNVAPAGKGPVISSLDNIAAASLKPALQQEDAGSTLIEPITWCAEDDEACALLLAPAAETVGVSALAAVAAVVADFVVVTAVGIGVGIVLSAILDILFPTPIAIGGVLEYPISPDTNFDTFSDWGEDDGQWYNSLKLYAEVVKTTKEVAAEDGIPFTWDEQSDSQLKIAVDEACTAQQNASFFPAGCGTNFAVYVPGGVNYRFQPMNQTGAHIAAALGGNGGLPNPPSRSVWYYPARSIGGQAAISAGFQRNWYKTSAFKPNACDNQATGQTCDEFPFWSTNQAVNLSGMTADLKLTPTAEGRSQGNDISAFYRECQVNNNEKFIVLPVAPWIAAGGPSFGFRVTDDGASLCMAPSVPTP
jgi:fibronectin type III domain protein/deoxyribonuclease NucA/NucB